MSAQTGASQMGTGGSELPKEMRDRSRSSRSSSKTVIMAVVAVFIIIVAGAAYGLGAFKCASDGGSGCATGQSILGSGSTLVQPLMGVWQQEYTADEVNYQAVGSGTGIDDLQTQTVDYGASDAPASYSQTQGFKGNPILTIPESAGEVAIIYNLPGVPSQLRFNGAFLADAYSGTITNWNSSVLQGLNPGVALPIEPIGIVHRSDGSGTSYAYQQFLSADSTMWASQYGYATTYLGPTNLNGEIAEKGNAGVTATVQMTSWSIGYVDLVYALQIGLSFGSVENPAGNFIVPTIAAGAAAIHNITTAPGYTFPAGNGNWSGVSMINSPGTVDYPITTLTYVLVYEHPDVAFGSSSSVMSSGVAQSLRAFILWAVNATGGQRYSGQEYYIPLPATIVALDEATVAMMTWGGSPITCTT
ncbi:MAG: phosphate ABC transporter substrate-binding protein PstS [Thermoplasmata archaeon]